MSGNYKRLAKPHGKVFGEKELKTAIRKELRKRDEAEMTFIDTVPNTTTPVSYDAPYTLNLTKVAVGDNAQERQGSQIGVTRVELWLYAFRNASNTSGSHDRMTIALIRSNKEIAGTGPVWSDVFDYTGAQTSVVPLRYIGGDESEYAVLKTWEWDLGDSTGNPKSTKHGQFTKSYKLPQKLTYIGDAADAASQGTGHYFVIATSDVISGGYPPYIQVASRIHFKP